MILHSFKRPLLTILISSITLHVAAAPDTTPIQGNAPDPCASNQNQVAGAVLGALVGGFLGNKIGKGTGRKVATVAGALGGLALGNYVGSELDRRKCEVSKIAQKNKLTISMTDIALPTDPDDITPNSRSSDDAPKVGMSVAIQDQVHEQPLTDTSGGDKLGNAAQSSQFRSGSDVLSPEAESYFREIARQYALAFDSNALPQDASADQLRAVEGLRQKRILIVGHTDDTGNSRLNADLSEQRARNVARLFAEAGVPASHMFFQGSGETQPIADNRTDSGRARNRRVEIVDLPDEAAFQKYLASRVANTSYYRVADTPSAPHVTVQPPAAPAGKPRTAAGRDTSPAATSGHAAAPAPAHGAPTGTPQTARPAVLAGAGAGYDFGGLPSEQKPVSIDIGRPLAPKGFNFITPAIADDMPTARSCADDRPRYANAVKELQSNREYHVSEYMPNLYDTSWTDTVNGNLVALTHVAVLRGGAAPAHNPTVLIYKASHGKAHQASKADFTTVAQVNTYQGERGLLYRVFVNGPIQCMDLVLPRSQSSQTVNSNLYYQAGSTKMVAAFNPKIVK